MKQLIKFLAISTLALASVFSHASNVAEAPDALIKRISAKVLNTAKNDPEIQAGNKQKVLALVKTSFLPHLDFDRMTALAVGRHWRTATAEQRETFIVEFRQLLIHTYSGALTHVKDMKLQFKPYRGAPDATDAIIYSRVVQSGREPIALNYRLSKQETGWKIYDINVLGAWLVQTYRSTFSSEISKSGIAGLLQKLKEKNNKLALAAQK